MAARNEPSRHIDHNRQRASQVKFLAGVISDTHGKLHADVFDIFKNVQVIFHCGDVDTPVILSDLEAIAPVHAVLGNMDPIAVSRSLTRRLEVEIDGRRFALTHGHLYPHLTERAIGRMIADCVNPPPHVFMFGHTHRWYWKQHGAVRVLNPGSASRPYDNDAPSVCLLTHDDALDKWTAERIDLKK
jgi:putative phosphoesterase